ncbi:MAG: AtpZ/AtpI family protein [Planctomycetota bacterium]|nr:AtpZ/AtpI family protein [Planctomycetota bacterium]
MSEDSDERRKTVKKIAQHGSSGFAAGLVLAVFVLGGVWLDGYFHTKPVLTLVGIGLGIVGAMLALLKPLLTKDKDDDK